MDDPFYHGGGITLEEFLQRTNEAAAPFLATVQGLIAAPPDYTKHQYSTLLNEARSYETYLDDHGARENSEWEFHAELVASIRNLGISAFHVCHVLKRFKRSYIEELDKKDVLFLKDLAETLDFINESWRRLALEACRESERLGLEVPPGKAPPTSSSDSRLDGKLPKSGEMVEVQEADTRMLALVRKTRKALGLARDFRVSTDLDSEALLEAIPTKIDVKKIQKIMNLLQGVQSDYDTYVRRTSLEEEHPCLPSLRGASATSLHLIVALRWLIHFYERHLDPIRSSLIKKRMSELVEKSELLDCAINHLYRGACDYLDKANTCAEELLTRYAEVERTELPLPKPVGFHARPATYVSLIVNEYGTDVFIIVGKERYSAKSVMALLEAGWILSDKGATSVVYEGDKRVLQDLRILAEHNYCEDQDIPRELSYLRILRNR
jgi:phosphotransferase system HPr-like phosphotransfer protein